MLQTVIDVSKNYGNVFLVSLLGGLSATAFAAWFAVTMVAIYVKFYPGSEACSKSGGSCSQAKVVGLLIFITFSGYWISEVIKNVIHVSISGVYGSWYFCSQKPGGLPKGSTRGAFKRAMTYSFGSISFGSLIVAIIQMLRQACSIAQSVKIRQTLICADSNSRNLGKMKQQMEISLVYFSSAVFIFLSVYLTGQFNS